MTLKYILLLMVTAMCRRTRSENYTIGFLPAMSDYASRSARNLGREYAGAIQVALDDLRVHPDYRHLNFSFIYRNTRFDTDTTLKAMVDMHVEGADMYLGPENTCVFSAKLAASINKPIIGYRCLDSELSDKKAYPTFARTGPGTHTVTKSILSLMNYHSWKSFSVVREETEEWQEVSKTLASDAKIHHINVNSNDSFSFPSGFRPFGKHEQEICNIVIKSSNITRVYVFLGEHDALVSFMRCLNNHTDVSQYAVMHVRGLDDAEDIKSIQTLSLYWAEQGCVEFPDFPGCPEVFDLAEYITPFTQLITIVPRISEHDTNYQNFVNKTREYLYGDPWNVGKAPPPAQIPISVYAAKVYDAVRLYAHAVKTVLDGGGDPRDGGTLMNAIFNTSYHSIQNFTETIDMHGDAEGAYSAIAMIRDSPNGNFSVAQVGSFVGTSDNKIEYRELRSMSWLDEGKAPRSEPECGFDNPTCYFPSVSDKINIPLIVTLTSSVAVVLMILSICSWRQYKQRKQIDSLLWKLDKCDIEIVSYNNNNNSSDDQYYFGESGLPVSSQDHDDVDTPWQFLEDEEEINRPQLPYYSPVGYYKNMLVSLKCVRNSLEISSALKKQLHMLKELGHENVNRFVGACVDPHEILIVTQYCSRGSLEDVLMENRNLFLEDFTMQCSLISDLVKGMMFLHSSPVGCHGNLKSTKCLVDTRFVLQISGFGMHHFRKNEEADSMKGTDKYYRDRLWKAPELLRSRDIVGTQKGDIYSFGIILHEILALLGPWGDTRLSDRDIVTKVQSGHLPLTRPNMHVVNSEDYLKKCMEDCWSESPEARPDFKTLDDRKLKPLRDLLGSNILENMLERIEKYTKNLESLVDERTHQLNTEKRKTEKLLHRMLPKSVAEDLMRGKEVQARYYDSVTVYFSDIVGFTKLCSDSDPYQIVKFLNDLYTRFDGIINNYDVYKVETIGDAYMVVSGLPKPNGDNHAGEIASMSLHLLSALKNFKIHHRPGESLKLRIGLHSGPVAVGVVGIKMPRYCLFGDTVNTTARMESNGLPLRVHISEPCKNILDKLGGYYVEKRGLVEMKGKGEVLTYWLVGEDSFHRIRRLAEVQGPYSVDSACTSARSSFNDSLHLMPNGFRRPKINRDQFNLDEFRLRPPVMTNNSRKSLRRGSMPINDYMRRGSLGMGILEHLNTRRESRSCDSDELQIKSQGSSPLNLKRTFELKAGWELREDDERRPCVESPLAIDPKATERISPEGCDSISESMSRHGSGKSATTMKINANRTNDVIINIITPPAEQSNQNSDQENTTAETRSQPNISSLSEESESEQEETTPDLPGTQNDAGHVDIDISTPSADKTADKTECHKLSSSSMLHMECSV